MNMWTICNKISITIALESSSFSNMGILKTLMMAGSVFDNDEFNGECVITTWEQDSKSMHHRLLIIRPSNSCVIAGSTTSTGIPDQVFSS